MFSSHVLCLNFYYFLALTNDRYVCLQFKNGELAATIHGFAGYFDTVLYDTVLLSKLLKFL